MLAVVSSSRLIGIPTIPFSASSSEAYHISAVRTIIVDHQYADWADKSGETLIPPRLLEFASTFAGDLRDIWGLNVSVSVASSPQPNSIYLTIEEKPSYWYASGEASSEGYAFDVTFSGVTIYGASPLGVWWATRSLIQQSILAGGGLPLGKAVDFPGWKTRGMMLDAARHYYPPKYIVELCSYMSFFKQNTLQLHLSDNLYNNAKIYSRERSLGLYARFRLWSDSAEVEGLNKFKNESYTKEQFKGIQSACVARGVTIIPEIEAPGHALPFVQWKPELGLSTDLSLLNISHPDTIPTMKTIWRVFFDWFDSKTVHIGADEYTGEVSEYNRFVNEMAKFIRNTGSKSVRIWGTFPPKPEYENISNDISIQHWEFFEDNPLFDYIEKNYSVVNSDDTFYVVNKWSGSYPQKVNIAKTFNGNPANNGLWQPYIFDTKNSTNNPERSNKYILGAVAPLWNDYGANATVYSEAYYAWREGIPALADKQWGGDLSEEEFSSVFPALHPLIPGQNLERSIPSKTSTILHYDTDSWKQDQQHPSPSFDLRDMSRVPVLDKSGNNYTASTTCAITPNNTLQITPACSLKTPFSSKGRNYTLSLKLYINHTSSSPDTTIISGADSTLMLTPNITLFASGNYYRLNSTLPLKTWIDLRIIGRGDHTFASLRETSLQDPFPEVLSVNNSEEEEEFQAVLGINGVSFVWAPIAIEAPIAELGGSNAGWTGEFAGLVLSSEA
ncbi:glycoside hydrolase family 20 protein [Xylariaceae sp. AK1471]|nr:glycoside hydrolase family 20 protein [Xylariaceae sp. AK1471]